LKKKTVFVCNECGAESVKWYGRCPSCNGWNTLIEESVIEEKGKSGKREHIAGKPLPIKEISGGDTERYVLGMPELDGVLGGGLVPGSSILLGGEPGIGKSTLLLQVAKMMGDHHGLALYITGEESAYQVKMRAQRLDALCDQMMLLAETDLERALEAAKALPVAVLIIDSVQAVYLPELDSAPGSVSQVRACAAACLEFARQKNAVVILVGHVTKEGALAGPRVLEHMVDTVLYFEGERHTSFRLLRTVKNRFGSTNDIGIFEMGEKGLFPYAQPSLFFLSQRPKSASGSAVTCVMQGSRPMLMEIQALVVPSVFGNPRRLASGIDYNRLLLIIAVLERKLGLSLGNKDIYVNVAGGMRIEDPAADLAVAAAIASAYYDRPIEEKLFLLGEIGLLGEVRSIGQLERRKKEGMNFGFDMALVPQANTPQEGRKKGADITLSSHLPGKLITVADLPEVLNILGLC